MSTTPVSYDFSAVLTQIMPLLYVVISMFIVIALIKELKEVF